MPLELVSGFWRQCWPAEQFFDSGQFFYQGLGLGCCVCGAALLLQWCVIVTREVYALPPNGLHGNTASLTILLKSSALQPAKMAHAAAVNICVSCVTAPQPA